MLVIPIIGKISWRNPPIVTLVFVITNIVVFVLSMMFGLREAIDSYGFRPAVHEPVTLITHMFLHGGISHLVGNMIFLWLVGCMLEMGGGRLFFIFCYLLTGLASAGLFWLTYSSSNIPCVGASGAISGLMGAMAAMFGMSKIRVFYSLGFYFDYVKIPAIILLPLWIGNELFQLYMNPNSHIAYMAHLGGLISGALIAFAGKRFLKGVNTGFMEEAGDEVVPLVEAAMKHLEKLEIKEARKLLTQALQKSPQNEAILLRLFDIDKQAADGPEFHYTAEKLLTALSSDLSKNNQLYHTYMQYKRLNSSPRLSLSLYGKLCSIFITMGHIEEAEEILEMLIEKNPGLHFLPSLSYYLAQFYKDKSLEEKSNHWNRVICDFYPESQEAVVIREGIQKI